MTSRLATHDSMATFLFACALFFAQIGGTQRRDGFLLAGSVTMSLSIITKYVFVLFLPFLISYSLLIRADFERWLRLYVLPVIGLLGLFILTNWQEILVSIAIAGRNGFWVDRSAVGVLWETLQIIGLSVPLVFIGCLQAEGRNRLRAIWIAVGASLLIQYHVYDRHIGSLVKGLAAVQLTVAPLVGAGLQKLVDSCRCERWLVSLACSTGVVVALFFGTYYLPRGELTFWEDHYGPIEIIVKLAKELEEPNIFTTRPHELVCLAPTLRDHVNQGIVPPGLPGRLKPYVATRYVVHENSLIANILAEEYDIVHLTWEYWYGADPRNRPFIRSMRRALEARGYLDVFIDDRTGPTSFGTIRKPAFSHVLVRSGLDGLVKEEVRPKEMPPTIASLGCRGHDVAH
jgi:hypothetical protein